MRKALIAFVAVAMLAFAGTASAGADGHAKLWVYDPGNTHGATAKWTQDGLSLEKTVDTSVPASAGVEIKGVEGETLEELSFEVKGDCTGGAPRFNVYTNGGTKFIGCAHGETSDIGDGWTRVTFDQDVVGGEGAFGSILNGVDLMLDEQGEALLRNISVNNVVVKKTA